MDSKCYYNNSLGGDSYSDSICRLEAEFVRRFNIPGPYWHFWNWVGICFCKDKKYLVFDFSPRFVGMAYHII